MDETMEYGFPGDTPAPSGSDWTTWLQDVARYGLQKRWDAEYLLPFQVAMQVPKQTVSPLFGGAGGTPGALPGWVVPAVAVVAGSAILWAVLKD